jgi:hypothetical protein
MSDAPGIVEISATELVDGFIRQAIPESFRNTKHSIQLLSNRLTRKCGYPEGFTPQSPSVLVFNLEGGHTSEPLGFSIQPRRGSASEPRVAGLWRQPWVNGFWYSTPTGLRPNPNLPVEFSLAVYERRPTSICGFYKHQAGPDRMTRNLLRREEHR